MRTPKEDREITAGGYTYQENGTRAERMTIYTSDYSYMAKLDKYVEKNPEEWHVEKVYTDGEDVTGKQYSCPTSCLSFRMKTVRARELTEEEKQERRERLAALRYARSV